MDVNVLRAEVIIDDVIAELEGRKGFGGWWDGIDEKIQDEIKSTLKERVLKTLRRQIP